MIFVELGNDNPLTPVTPRTSSVSQISSNINKSLELVTSRTSKFMIRDPCSDQNADFSLFPIKLSANNSENSPW